MIRTAYLAFFLLCLAFGAGRPQEQATTADQYITQGEAALRQNRYAEAKAYFEQAEKLPGANVAEVDAGLAMADLELGQYEAARQRERKVLELVSHPHERAEAHNLIGTAWLRESGDGPSDADKLRAAEQEFRQAVAIDPFFDYAYFNLGTALSQLGQDAGAAAAFKSSVEAAGKNPASAVDLPFRPQAGAPAFTATDSHGATVSLAAQRGRFVLLDFWATWCGPCIHALPIVRQLATYFPPDQFTLISVDEDYDNRDAWRSFISQQKMSWTQIWDENSDIYHSFGLAPRPQMIIPRYVFLDPDGSVLHVYTGTDRVGIMAGQIVRTVAAARPPQQTN
ncbi:MAG TPA: redoxin family protein [Candidatus Acidoferrum sp.]|nr:redoxin family protein [Candidatus Acidoferrum sp.]